MTTTTHHESHTEHPQTPPAPVVPEGNGQAVASLVLGIFSITSTGLLTGIPAIIFGVLSIKKHPRNKGLGIAGIVTGGIGTLLSFIFIAFLILLFSLSPSSGPRNYPQPTSPHHLPSTRV